VRLRSPGSDAANGSGDDPVDWHRRSIATMDDTAIFDQLRTLADEEHAIREQGPQGDADRLQDIEVMLDQCWDLLRQRRAKREFGGDPDDAKVRDANVVEHYQQ
jgi:hypothetical protein